MAIWGIERCIPKGWFEPRNRCYQPNSQPEGNALSTPPTPRKLRDLSPKSETHDTYELTKSLLGAAERAEQAWSKVQLIDALQSVRFWTNEIEKAISK